MTDAAATEDQDDPIINLRGELVGLGPLHEGLLPRLVRWANDFESRYLASDEVAPHSPTEVAARWEPLIRGERPDWIGFAIYELATLRPIGTTNIRDFTTPQRTAEFGITIGEPTCRGKGYGTEATRLVLDYAFTALGVHNVWLDVVAFNERAIRAYRRAGFREIGRRREAYRIGPVAHDVVLMDCLATESRELIDPGVVSAPG